LNSVCVCQSFTETVAPKTTARTTPGHPNTSPSPGSQVNLHVFEDWCGGSIAKLRANLHYPLYAHSRSTLKKLAVSPMWINYGLRIFGYIHPYADGEFLFAVASNDNCELWLSMDESPDNLQICAFVGKSGKEWTAPGEYMKYSSQISQPLLLQQQKRYYFELIHKQNAEGTDHVEVTWRLNKAGTKFEIIDSESLSLYTNESLLKMNDVSHIPQTAASHVVLPGATGPYPAHGAEMLKEDSRDTFYQIPLLDGTYLLGVLPECAYKPSYIIKDFPLLRYQGLQFVRLSYIYPNDYTRLTHMESDNTCFYQMRGLYLQRGQPGYAEYYNDYMMQEPRRLLSSSQTTGKSRSRRRRKLQEKVTGLELESKPLTPTAELPAGNFREMQGIAGKSADSAGTLDRVKREPVVSAELGHFTNRTVHGDLRKKDKMKNLPALSDSRDKPNAEEEGPKKEQETEMDKDIDERKWRLSKDKGEDDTIDQWAHYEESDADEDVGWVAVDPEVNWAQTFKVSHHDFQTLRSDWIDLNCNVSGNLLIEETEAIAVVEAFMKKLNQKYPKKFTLQRIVNVEKRADIIRGSRYLLELDLLYKAHRRLRLAHYIYVLDKTFVKRPILSPPESSHKGSMLLCSPRGFQWNPGATVHFIVPVKNQARWVQQFIVDMEELYQVTGDENFNIILADYSSTDMDIEQALKKSHLPKSQYIRLHGNFQRSAGLQAGIDLISDEHSILFLCDLHLRFPRGFIDTVRRHCVERHMAFAPIVMRLNCGATPQEPDGYWEVNGFGLLGIYKSDLDSIGGMNTREFTDRWGGEDWELLDRILQAGLEVERIYIRNFFHHYHSKRGMWNRKTIRSK
uniref:Beta-1,4-N-acetylgalactosaminyltransferase n=1 Tax=Electrophorus electricus TaxID=8005 RepID=A0AAY5ENB0_ELEEL